VGLEIAQKKVDYLVGCSSNLNLEIVCPLARTLTDRHKKGFVRNLKHGSD
jgi:hypothetical protein